MKICKQKERKKGFDIVFYLVLSLFIITNSVQISMEQGYSTLLASKQPIVSAIHPNVVIDGDTALDAFCAGNGTDGSNLNPHVIENFDMDDTEGDETGIEIRNISKYLIIRNCSFLSVYESIKIINSTNIKITNSTFNKCAYGINILNSNNISFYDNNLTHIGLQEVYLENSHNNSIYNNLFSESFQFIFLNNSNRNIISGNELILVDPHDMMTYPGIRIFYSNENTISYNNISFVQYNGIQLRYSSDNRVFNNSIFEYGIECISDSYGENNSIYDNYCGNANGPYEGPNFIGLYVMLGISIIGGIIVGVYIVVKYLIQKERKIERKGISIISLYVSLVGILVPGLSIIAIILGFLGKNKEGSNKIATAGIAFGFIYTIFQIIMYILSRWFLAYYLIFQ